MTAEDLKRVDELINESNEALKCAELTADDAFERKCQRESIAYSNLAIAMMLRDQVKATPAFDMPVDLDQLLASMPSDPKSALGAIKNTSLFSCGTQTCGQCILCALKRLNKPGTISFPMEYDGGSKP